MTQSFRWWRFLVLGFVAAAALLLCTPVWMLAQVGSPQPFSIICALVVVPLLVFVLLFVKSARPTHAAVAGLLFSVPVVAVCFLLPFFDVMVQQDFRGEVRYDGLVTLLGSVCLSVAVSSLRKRNPSPSGAAANGCPGTRPGNPEASDGLSSVS